MARRVSHRTALLSAAVLAAAVLAGCASRSDPKPAAGLGALTQEIGGLEVKVTPTRLDDSGAVFEVAFDTHTGAPTIDVADRARLVVDRAAWTQAIWSEGAADDHHRSGTLRFDASGPAERSAELTIRGLDEPLTMTWQLRP